LVPDLSAARSPRGSHRIAPARSRFAPWLHASSLVPVVNLPAEWNGPGQIRQKSNGYLVAPDHENGRDFTRLFAHTALTATTTADFLSQAWRKLALNPQGINSIHADRLAGRPTEIDARNGAVVRIGKSHGIDAPMNRLLVTLIKELTPQLANPTR
jgi:ketopantoate reductase